MGLKEYIFGFDCEKTACKFLQNSGYEILERNFKKKFGEIDIIAKKGEILHFIEVKSTNGKYEVAYRITQAKFEKITKTAQFYMQKFGLENDFQIDLVCVKSGKIEILENISF